MKEENFRPARQRLLLRVERGAEGHCNRFSGAVERFDLVEGDRVFLLRFCRSVNPGEAEVVQIERIDPALRPRQDPDAVKVGVSLDFKTSGEVLPLLRRAEGESAEHRVVGVAVAIGVGPEVDPEELIRRIVALFVLPGPRVEGDLHLTRLAEVEILERTAVAAQPAVAGKHDAAAGVPALDGERQVDAVGIGIDHLVENPDMFEFHSGGRTVEHAEFGGGVVVDRPGRSQTADPGKQCNGKWFHFRTSLSLQRIIPEVPRGSNHLAEKNGKKGGFFCYEKSP